MTSTDVSATDVSAEAALLGRRSFLWGLVTGVRRTLVLGGTLSVLAVYADDIASLSPLGADTWRFPPGAVAAPAGLALTPVCRALRDPLYRPSTAAAVRTRLGRRRRRASWAWSCWRSSSAA